MTAVPLSQADIAAEGPPRPAWDALMGAHLAAFTALGCFCAISQRYLFADGANLNTCVVVKLWIAADNPLILLRDLKRPVGEMTKEGV